MEIVRLVWKTFLNQQRICIELQKSLPQYSSADAVSSCHPKRSAVMKEEELSEDASIALASSDSPLDVLLGRKEFDADSEEIDAGCCGVSSADLDVFGSRIISGDFKNLKSLNFVGYSFPYFFCGYVSCVKKYRLLTSEVQWGNQIDDAGCLALGRCLPHLSALVELDLRCNYVHTYLAFT